MKPLEERWVVIGGSIYTERAELKKSEFTGKPLQEPQREAIAFNVGKTAEHIVALHNDWIKRCQPTG